MSAYNSKSATQSFHDPSTYIQRPISAKTPDVAHILTSIFGEIYTKDVLTTDLIKNLTVSSDVDDQYHKRYVNKLKEAQLIKENRVQEYAMLEKHILEAQAKALAYEEREDEKRKKICENPDDFGVPPAKSFFSHCLDDALLKEHGLLVPSDYYYKAKKPTCPMPKSELPDSHLRETVASRARNLAKSSMKSKLKSRTPGINDIEELHKSGSELSDDGPSLFNSDEEDEETEANRFKKPFWKESIRQESRNNFKHGLKKIENRIKYLPNPRLEAIKTEQVNITIESTLEINPKYILFSNYTIGKVYESSFEVRNISMISHQIRALPPKFQFFSLSLGQYPQNQSVIAPGLGAIYNVRFAPDSLCTYEDEILVECSNGCKIIVPLIARRESPSLSIGSEIDCGKALVGQIKVCRYLIQNEGGDGRFVVLPKSAWPGSTFKTNVSSSNLTLPPFEIQPSIFELRKRDVFALEVVFKPSDIKSYEQDIIIACDNCTTIEFKLIGQGELAEIEYFQQDDDFHSSLGENSILIDEYKDISSNKIIRFPALNPNVYTRKRFSVRNKSSSPIDYSWFIYKPILEDNLLIEANSKKFNYVLDKETFFSVAPRQGTLDRNDVKVFEILFAPTKVGSFNSVAHFTMHGIPEINKQLILNGKKDEISNHKPTLTKEDMTITDFIGVVVELKGECEPFQFTLDPPAIFVPGATYMQTTARKAFRLINMSICPINFNWKQIVDPHVIQVEPSYGEIAPKSYALMEALITGAKPGKLVDDIPCYVEFADEPIYLHVEADIKGPEMIIQEAGLDFGLVQIGTICETFITIENISNLLVKWTLQPLSHKELFRFPSNGSLQPLETFKIEISFIPKEEIILNTQFEFKIEDSENLLCNCFAQAQRPSASLLETQLTLSNLFLGVPDIVIAKLCNHSIIEAEFNWGVPEGEDASSFELRIEPQSGILKSKSVLDCRIHVKSYSLCNLNDLRIPCYIQETTEPLFLNLIGSVKGVSVCYYYSHPGEEEHETQLNNGSVIDFGNVKVGQEIQRSLIIKNVSGINTSVKLGIKNFQVIESNDKNEQTQFYDPLQKKSKLSDKYKLKDPISGVGFVIDNSEFYLPAFGSVKFNLLALCEIWGSYEDTLIINIDGIDQEDTIPLKLTIVDSPFKIFSSKVSEDEREEISMIRFGTQIQGNGLVKRNLKIQNLSWIPIEINWKIFIVEQNDKKLVDVNVLFDDITESDLIKLANLQQNKPNTSQKQTTHRSTHSNIKDLTNRDPLPSLRSSDNSFDLNENENNYVYVEQLSLVKINLTKHYGTEIDDAESSVFFLSKNKNKMKPREKTNIEIFFNTETKQCQAYEAVFVGYLNLEPNFIKGPGYERKIGFDKEPICFKVTAHLDSPNLIVELNDDLNFDVTIGDLIQNKNHIVNERIFKNQFSLLNNSLAPIEFELNTKEPFYFQNFYTSTRRIQLKPKSKQKVDVLFKFNTNLIQELNFKQLNCANLKEKIMINYSKEISQSIPIKAKIMAPEIKATKDYIDFGICLVGQERYQQFSIRNPSCSSLIWRIEIENNQDFAFDSDIKNGFLEASQFFISTSEQIVSVYFNAKHNEVYNAKLIVKAEPSNNELNYITIMLSGVGTFDQNQEAILNV